MKNWLRKRLSERSTKFAAMLVIAFAGIAGFELTVEQQASLQQWLGLTIAMLLAFMADKPQPPEAKP